jgi:RNA polymerase sigma-70 factor (ECF subfamily)
MGDEQALQQLIYLYSERVFFQALTFVKSWQQAEEIVQDIFLRVWQKRNKLKDVEDWDKYLFVLSKNFLINVMQKKARHYESTDSEEIEDLLPRPDEQYANKELGVLLHRAVSQLPEQKRMVFEMIHQQGLSQDEVSKRIGIAPRTVRWNLVSAINEIKDFLQRHSGDILLLILILILFLMF